MSADEQNDDGGFSETSTQSWFPRLREAAGGILTGVVLVGASAVLLFWNEGRAVKSADALHEGAAQIVAAQADVVDPKLEGKLVHVSGPVRIVAPPRAPEIDLSVQGLRLERKVEMYQWRENKSVTSEKKLGGSEETVTHYSYERVWSEAPLASEGFRQPQGHANPPFPLRSLNLHATAKVGTRDVPAGSLSGLGHAQPIALEARQAAQIGTRLGQHATLIDGGVMLGADAARPQVGDLRIHYALARVETASIAAQQKGSQLVPFVAGNGRTVFLAREGTVPAAEMFQSALEANANLTWMLRAIGVVLSIGGFHLMLRLARVLADVVPIFGSVVGFGTNIIAALLGVSFSALVAGLAWIFHRPLIGAGLLALAGLCLVLVWRQTRARAAVQTA